MTGSTISHFQILEKLGSGGMAVVYKALDVKLGRKVALKFLRGHTSPMAAERLLREAQTASALDHPNICTVYEIGETADHRRFIAMAYYDGETLGERLERGPLKLDEAVGIALGVARGLDRAHRHGIVHQDVKPHNVMLLAGGEDSADGVKILDFGIAQLGGRPHGNPSAGVYGTISYMAPERLYKGHDPDPRSDVWSLGVLLYEMVGGENPFQRDDAYETAEAIRNQPYRVIASLREPEGANLNALLSRTLEQDPAARYPDMASLVHDLEALERLVSSKTHTQPVTGVLEESGPSIAVLPFADQSPRHDQEHLCFGIAEELVRLLTSSSRLKVAPFMSTRQSAAGGGSPEELGRQLRVTTVLEGSVHKGGDRLRVVVRLVRVRDGRCIWSEKYDRQFEDLFDIQDEIAEKIVLALEITLMGKPESRRGGADLEAYNFLLKGRYYWNKRTEEDTEKGITFFRQAIGRDAGYARAWAGLADSYAMQGIYGWLKPEDVMPRAREAAEKALANDPAAADVFASRAAVRAVYQWDFAGAESDFERAIELDPGYAIAYQWYAMNTLLPLGRFDEAWQRLGEAHELDPLSLPITASKGIYLYYLRRYDDAIAELEKALEIDTSFVPAHLFMSHCYAGLGRFDDARRELEEAEVLAGERPDILAALGQILAATGAADEVKQVLDRLYRAGRKRYVSPSLRAQVYLALDRPRVALDALKAAFNVRAADLVWLGLNPFFESLHREGDFEMMLVMIGIGAHGPGA